MGDLPEHDDAGHGSSIGSVYHTRRQIDGECFKPGCVYGKRLKALQGDHPNVVDIRVGLFWGLVFVKDKATKEPLEP